VYCVLAISCVAGIAFLEIFVLSAREYSQARAWGGLRSLRKFCSYCLLDYPEYELIFCSGDSDDPAVPVIEKLQLIFSAMLHRV